MDWNGQLELGGLATFVGPALALNGEWGTAAGIAVRESLSRGSLDGVMDVLNGLEGRQLANVLGEAGFPVREGVVERGREAILIDVQMALIKAVEQRVDGFELQADREASVEANFAAKEEWSGLGGAPQAMQAIQRVFAATQVDVDFIGTAPAMERGALLCIAGQAMEAGVQGFGFDGVPGKYEVPCPMRDVVALHEAAAAAVAVETVREATDIWRAGGKVGELSHWVPDSVQRILQGGISENAARTLIHAVDDGVIARYAAESGLHTITQVLAERGLDINAPTIEAQAEMIGLDLVEPDRERGKYAGPVVGVDHRAGLVKYSRTNGIEVPFSTLAKDQGRLQLGDRVRVDFNRGSAVVKVAARDTHEVER